MTAEVYDLTAIQGRDRLMSAPCCMVNDTQVSFGRKNIRQVVEMVKQQG